MTDLIQDIARRLDAGSVIPYLGPDMLSLCEAGKVPSTPLDLATFMTATVSVPHKVRTRLTQAAEHLEAIEVGEHHVENDQIGPELGHKTERLAGSGGDLDFEALVAQ